MRPTTITAEEVAAIAAALVAEGQAPTLRAVRDALGTGSLTTLAPLLRAWKEQEAKAHAAPPPTPLTEAARQALERLGAELWTLAEKQAAERLEAERAETERVRAELGAERDEALQAADEAASARVKAEEAAKNAQEGRDEARDRAAQLEGEKIALEEGCFSFFTSIRFIFDMQISVYGSAWQFWFSDMSLTSRRSFFSQNR